MSRVWLTSDLHLGHVKIAELRGFGTGPDAVTKHDDAICANWEAVVGPDDVALVLGDLALRGAATRRALDRLLSLSGIKHLVSGNHDETHPSARQAFSAAVLARYGAVFASVSSMRALRLTAANRENLARADVPRVDAIACHHPYVGDSGPVDRDTVWRPRDEGRVIVHGHVHARERLTFTPAGTPQVHVGLDAWDLMPVPLERVTQFALAGLRQAPR